MAGFTAELEICILHWKNLKPLENICILHWKNLYLGGTGNLYLALNTTLPKYECYSPATFTKLRSAEFDGRYQKWYSCSNTICQILQVHRVHQVQSTIILVLNQNVSDPSKFVRSQIRPTRPKNCFLSVVMKLRWNWQGNLGLLQILTRKHNRVTDHCIVTQWENQNPDMFCAEKK